MFLFLFVVAQIKGLQELVLLLTHRTAASKLTLDNGRRRPRWPLYRRHAVLLQVKMERQEVDYPYDGGRHREPVVHADEVAPPPRVPYAAEERPEDPPQAEVGDDGQRLAAGGVLAGHQVAHVQDRGHPHHVEREDLEDLEDDEGRRSLDERQACEDVGEKLRVPRIKTIVLTCEVYDVAGEAYYEYVGVAPKVDDFLRKEQKWQ